MYKIKCAEIWGGIKNAELDVCSAGITASLYSSSCDGGKGGDAYLFSVCGEDKLTRLALADVVGHGEKVSRISQWVYDQLEAHMGDVNQTKIMQYLNNRVADHGYDAMTTAVIVSYYLKNNHLYYCYAGHPPMLARSGSSSWHDVKLPDAPEVRNLPLGVKRDVRYDMGEVPYHSGDRLFLYSDGVIEAPGKNRDYFGVDRLRSTLESAGNAEPMQIKSHVLAALRDWTGGSLDHDDVTLVAIQLA